jgi:hypothetical protein
MKELRSNISKEYWKILNSGCRKKQPNISISSLFYFFPRQLKIEIGLYFLGSSDFSLFLNMGIIFHDSHVPDALPESNIQLNNLT